MLDDQKLLIEIISGYINERPTQLEDEFCSIAVLAQHHQLTPVIYYKTRLPQLSTAYYSALSLHTRMDKQNTMLKSAFEEANICAFQIKGSVVSSFYPHPALRTMGDTDFVVSDLNKAHNVMQKNGFRCISHVEGREWQYEKNGIEVELHDRLEFDEITSDDRLTKFLNDFWPHVVEGKLDLSFHFIYIIAHLRKHFMNRGVGLRQFLDVAFMMKNCQELKWGWIENNLKQIGMLQFSETIFAFIQQWWGVTSPIKPVVLVDDFYETGTDFIIKNGVFGFDNPDNADFKASNEARISKNGKLGMLGRAIMVTFPPYKKMLAIGPYKFLIGRPFLLPVAWVYRFIRGIRHKNVGLVTKPFISNEYIEKREEMFRQWGLSEI